MANLSYLCRSDVRRTSPGLHPRYRAEDSTIAGGRWSIPLVWLALFRVEDLRTDRHVVDDEELVERAPVVSARTALARLAAGVARLEALFPRAGSLAGHRDALAAAIGGAKGRYLTIDLHEIAVLWSRRADFDAALARALRYVGGEAVPGARATVLQLSQLHAGRPFPPASGLYDRPRVLRADAENLARLLGGEVVRPLAWEATAPRPPMKVPQLLAAVEAADLAGVDAALAARRPDAKVVDRALDVAAAAGAVAIVVRLATAATAAGRSSAMRHAADRGQVRAVEALLAAGADPGGYDKLHSSLWQQVFWGKLPPRLLDAVIAHGGDVNRRMSGGGDYPLVRAAWVGKVRFVDALLARGADPHVRDAFRRTPLAIAARCGHVDATRRLLRAGATAAEVDAARREASKTLTDPRWPVKPAVAKGIRAALAALERAAGAWARA